MTIKTMIRAIEDPIATPMIVPRLMVSWLVWLFVEGAVLLSGRIAMICA